MKIAAKEAGETEYWITLCELSPSYPNPENLRETLQSIINILSKIIITSKSSQ
jgi:four helix bundle protein